MSDKADDKKAPEAEADEATEAEVTEPETFDIESAGPGDLIARKDDLQAQIDAMGDPASHSLKQAIARKALREERNRVVEAINALRAPDDFEDLDVVEGSKTEDQTPEVTDPVAEGAEATDTPITTDAPQEDAVTTEPTPTADASAPDAALAAQVEGEMELAHAAGAGEPKPKGGPAYTRPVMAYVAGAGQTAFAQGRELDMTTLTEAWKSQQNIRATRSTGAVRSVVASLPSFEETGELALEILNRDSVTRNDKLIAESAAAHRAMLRGEPVPQAYGAAICEPLDIIREIPFSGITATPFGDIFPQRPISRLGFTYTPASSISVPASGITIWTDEDQEGIDPDDSGTWKPTVLIECTDPLTVTAEELTTSATVDNSTEMSSPERVQEFMRKMAVMRARIREQYLLGLYDATAINWTWGEDYGVYATTIRAVETALPQMIYPERLDEGDYTLVLDPGLFNKMVMDEMTKCNDADEAANNVMSRLKAATGLRVVILHDFVGSSQFAALPNAGGGPAALTPLPAALKARLVPTPAYIFGATGEEQTGWQTDPQLSRQNRKQTFSAEWILLAKHAQHPAAVINITADANGARGACIEPA